jgi:aminocarboxymuconate-semialdehyde decarboxylase
MSHTEIETLDLGDALNRYGPTSARPLPDVAMRERKRPVDTPIVDIHAHVGVPEAAEYAKPHVVPNDIPMVRHSNALNREVNAQQEADRKVAMVDVEDRMKVLDAQGIDIQVVAPVPVQCYYSIPLEHAVKASRMVNDGVAAFVGQKPDRLVGLGTVPLQDAAEAVKALDYCINDLGFRGVQILTNVNGKELAAPEFAPFWERAQELGALVMIHPNGFTDGDRFKDYHFSNIIGNPLETTVALHHLIFSGTLERLPDLKILAVHGGGYLGAYSGRIDHAWGARKDAHAGLPKPPTHYLGKVFFDNVVFTPHQLEHLVKVWGADQIVMGSDYPFDMADYDPVGHVLSAGFDKDINAKIMGQNALRVLGLD